MKTQIMIIGHSENRFRIPESYKYIQRSSNNDLNIKNFHQFRNSSLVWSEYSAWFENIEFFNNANITGVFHYRCILNLTGLRFSLLPYQFRQYFLKSIDSRIQNLNNFIIVGKPISTPNGLWHQYFDCEPASIETLELACEVYDELLGAAQGTTLTRLHSTQEFIIRNIFITDTNFSFKWSELSLQIAKKLDDNILDNSNNRWGGFVLERFFSIYVHDFVKENDTELFFAKFIYFIELKRWCYNSSKKSLRSFVGKIKNLFHV